MEFPFLLAVIVFLLIQGISVYRMIRARQNEKQELKEWFEESDEISDAEKAWNGAQEGTGIHDEKVFSYAYSPAARYSLPELKVSVEAVSDGNFEIRAESGVDRFFKYVGIANDFQTHDPEFDKDFFIKTSTPEFTSTLLMHTGRRVAVREIIRAGFTSVRHDGKEMEAVWESFSVSEHLDRFTIASAAGRLAELAKNMPEVPHPAIESESGLKAARAAAFAVPSILIAAGAICLFTALEKFRPLDVVDLVMDSLKYSVPLLVFFLWSAVMTIKGKYSLKKELAVVAMLSLVAFPLSGAGIEMLLNGLLDDSEPTVRLVKVIKKKATLTQSKQNFYVVVESWRERRKTEKLGVSLSFFGKAVPGKTMAKVVTKGGRFGFEWLVSCDVAGR